MTLEDVRAVLDPEEPDYSQTVLGVEALPFLQEIAQGQDPLAASKAVHFASLIRDRQAIAVLQAAAEREDPQVRVAAAAAIQNFVNPILNKDLESISNKENGDAINSLILLLSSLLDDQDIGVRKMALKSVEAIGLVELKEKIEVLSVQDPSEFIRGMAIECLRQKECITEQTSE